jgi:hypothetical protein
MQYPYHKGDNMAKNDAPVYVYLENWGTRFGDSERVVLRQQGRIVDNFSLTALRKGETVQSSR